MPVTRFAPSPTGLLHVGHAYSSMFSMRAGDHFLLRIEDIDQTRCLPEYTAAIFEDLSWIELEWEEPVRVQSEHLEEFRAVASDLYEQGLIYPCFCSRSDVIRENLATGPDGPIYPGTCRSLSKQEREERMQSGEEFAMRLDMAEALRRTGKLTWHDRHAGEQQAQPELFGDVVIVRKHSPTSYHLSVVLDDAKQGIDLVTRGTDLFEATHVHRVLQELLDLPMPEYWHHGLLLDETGKRMSKRDGSTSIRSYRERGFSPEQLFEQFQHLSFPG